MESDNVLDVLEAVACEFGAPEAWEKDQVREWLLQILKVVGLIVKFTPTEIDDRAVDALLDAIENDDVWDFVWLLVDTFLLG